MSNKRNPRQYTEPKMYIGQPKLVSEANNRELIFVTVQTDSLSDRQDEKQLEISEMKGNKIEQGVQKQAFASKSIKEKLQFLMNLPSTMPSVTCEFRTKEEVYVGILISYTDDVVSIRHGTSGRLIKIQSNDLLSIAIIRL